MELGPSDLKAAEPAIRDVAVERADEAGTASTTDAVTITWVLTGAVPGAALFMASVPQPRGSFSVPGLYVPGEPPYAGPMSALSRAFDLWLAADGHLADPVTAARTAAFLYGGGDRLVVAVDEKSLSELREQVDDPELAEPIALPRAIDVDGQPGVELWWGTFTGVSRIRFVQDEPDSIDIERDPIEELD